VDCAVLEAKCDLVATQPLGSVDAGGLLREGNDLVDHFVLSKDWGFHFAGLGLAVLREELPDDQAPVLASSQEKSAVTWALLNCGKTVSVVKFRVTEPFFRSSKVITIVDRKYLFLIVLSLEFGVEINMEASILISKHYKLKSGPLEKARLTDAPRGLNEMVLINLAGTNFDQFQLPIHRSMPEHRVSA